MSTEDIIEKANKALSVANVVIYALSLLVFFSCGDWFGGRWYHWIFALLLAVILKAFLGIVAKEVIKASYGLVERNDNNG